MVTASSSDAICISAIAVKHPTSDVTYAFLPGEMAVECGNWDPDNDYAWSNSDAVIQFEHNGQTQNERPKCMWIDAPDKSKQAATSWNGFSVHLLDFMKDNSKWKQWQQDPYHMCGSKSRFGVYKSAQNYSKLCKPQHYHRFKLTCMLSVCPPVFESAPKAGELLPLVEYPTCFPSTTHDKNGIYEEDICKEKRIDWKEKMDLMKLFGHQDMRKQCPDGETKKRARQTRSGSNMDAIQSRFAGILVKSHDLGQSAVEVCTSKSSIGPNFYSHHEGMFCDMETRNLYHRCETSDQTDCFDT